MTYRTTLTSKGTATIPVVIRKQLGIKPGMYVSFVKSKDSNEYILKRSQSIEEVRALNKTALGHNKLQDYRSGDGFSAHVEQKYGK